MESSNSQNHVVVFAELFPGKRKDVKVGGFIFSFPKGAVKEKSKFEFRIGNSSQKPSCPSNSRMLSYICCKPAVRPSEEHVSVKLKTNCLPSGQDRAPVKVRIMEEKDGSGRWDLLTNADISNTGVVEFFCRTVGVLGVFLPKTSSKEVNIPLRGSIKQKPDGSHAFSLSMQSNVDDNQEKIDNQRLQLYDSNGKVTKCDPELHAMFNDEVTVSNGANEKKFVIDDLFVQTFEEYLLFHGPNSGTSDAKYKLTLRRSQSSTSRTVETREYSVPESPATKDADTTPTALSPGEIRFERSVNIGTQLSGNKFVYMGDDPQSMSNFILPRTDPSSSRQRSRSCGGIRFMSEVNIKKMVHDSELVLMKTETQTQEETPQDDLPTAHHEGAESMRQREERGRRPSRSRDRGRGGAADQIGISRRELDQPLPANNEQQPLEVIGSRSDSPSTDEGNRPSSPNTVPKVLYREEHDVQKIDDHSQSDEIKNDRPNGPPRDKEPWWRCGFDHRSFTELDKRHVLSIVIIAVLVAYILMA